MLCTDGWDSIAAMLWPVGIFTNYLPEGSAYIDKIDLLPDIFSGNSLISSGTFTVLERMLIIKIDELGQFLFINIKFLIQ